MIILIKTFEPFYSVIKMGSILITSSLDNRNKLFSKYNSDVPYKTVHFLLNINSAVPV